MAFFDNIDLSNTPPGGGLDPNDPRVRRLMQPPNVAPVPMPVDVTPPSQALQRIYAAQPPSPTSQGLISAVQGGRNDWSDAPAPPVDPRVMMRRYGITDLTPPPAPQVNPAHGFWGKLGQHLLGAVEGAGSQRGLLPMLVGGIAGGVRPQLGANAWYNNVTTPRWQQQAGAQQELANRRLGQIAQVGALTGIDPTTGQPTYAAQTAENKQDTADRLAEIKAENEKALAGHRQTIDDLKRQTVEQGFQVKQMQLDIADRNATSKEQQADIARQRAELAQQIAEFKQSQGQPTVTTNITEQPDPRMGDWQKGYNAYSDSLAQSGITPSSGYPPGKKYEDQMKAWKAKYPPPPSTKVETRTTARGGEPASQPAATNPAKVFPKSMLPKYMAAHPEYKTVEEAMKHIQDIGYTVQ